MLPLIVCLVLASVLAMLFVLWPLFLSRREPVLLRSDANVELYRQHKAELDAGLDTGKLEAAEHKVLLAELELSLLAEEAEESSAKIGPTTGANNSAAGRYVLWVLLPVLLIFSAYWYSTHGAAKDVEITQLADKKQRAEMLWYQASPEQQIILQEHLQKLPPVLQQKLSNRLEDKPENTSYWYLLARLSMEQGEYAKAQSAYESLLKYDAENTQVMAELAQARFLASGNRIDPIIDSLVVQVLGEDENNPTALGLAGISAFEGAKYSSAIDYWQRAIAIMGSQSSGAQALKAGIERATQLQGGLVVADGAVEMDTASVSLRVQVSLGELVVADSDQVVFVYARAWQGGKMPLAIAKLTVANLPTTIILDDSMAMVAGQGLSSVEQVELVARVSQSGKVTPAAGDWQVVLGPLNLSELDAPEMESLLKLVIADPVL